MEHNSRAVVNRYLGYWDANPATLIPLSPEDSAPLFVEMMGGAAPIIKKSKDLYAREILNKLVYAEPRNQAAKDRLADIFEQIGYLAGKPQNPVSATASWRQPTSCVQVFQPVPRPGLAGRI